VGPSADGLADFKDRVQSGQSLSPDDFKFVPHLLEAV
jgi:hypothetical protein